MQRTAIRPAAVRRRRRTSPRPGLDAQAGLTLVEVLVSISLLGIFAVGFAPVLYHGLAISADQATVAYSAQRASAYIDDARAATTASPSCAGLLAATSGAAPAISIDPRDVRVKVSGAVTGCETTPTSATAVTLTVTACRAPSAASDAAACSSTDRTLSVVSTKILVRG